MIEKTLPLITPRQAAERRRAIDEMAARELVDAWRPLIALAMDRGESLCDAQTSTAAMGCSLFGAACEALLEEMRPLGWRSLTWRPKTLGGFDMNQGISNDRYRGCSSTVQLTWSEKDLTGA